jgi:hypothetical protein
MTYQNIFNSVASNLGNVFKIFESTFFLRNVIIILIALIRALKIQFISEYPRIVRKMDCKPDYLDFSPKFVSSLYDFWQFA